MRRRSAPTRPVTVAVDMMGGEQTPEVLLRGILGYLRRTPRSRDNFSLIGDDRVLSPLVETVPRRYRARLGVLHATRKVSEHDSPARLLRTDIGGDSMYEAIKLVVAGEADACLSAGNTGALLALAQHNLGLLEGVSRPAICCRVPTERGFSYMLDVGGTINMSAQRLLQLARIATRLKSTPPSQPSVGLLNIGTESTKGTETIRQADDLLRSDPEIKYVGFIEGHTLFSGDVDVILCEAFTGNLVLKSIEGASDCVLRTLRRHKLSVALHPGLRRSFARLDARRYNGAVLLGLRSVVVKSHGGADAMAFSHAVEFSARPPWRFGGSEIYAT